MNKDQIEKLSNEIQTNTFKFIQDAVRAQIAAGAPDTGMPMKRHLALVSEVSVEMLASYPMPQDSDKDENVWQRWVLQQVYAGSTLNPSALRQDLEGKGKRDVILRKETPMENQYGVAV